MAATTTEMYKLCTNLGGWVGGWVGDEWPRVGMEWVIGWVCGWVGGSGWVEGWVGRLEWVWYTVCESLQKRVNSTARCSRDVRVFLRNGCETCELDRVASAKPLRNLAKPREIVAKPLRNSCVSV